MTDQQLRDRIAQAIASVTIAIGPNSLALLKDGHTLGLTGGEIATMALSALAAIQPELDRLALLNAGVREREALLTEARDLLEPYGGHGDDWPAIAPAISTLLAEVARLRTELATARHAGMLKAADVLDEIADKQDCFGDEGRHRTDGEHTRSSARAIRIYANHVASAPSV